MVHVTTPRPSIGAAIGQALGSVGGEYAGYQINRQRGRGRNFFATCECRDRWDARA